MLKKFPFIFLPVLLAACASKSPRPQGPAQKIPIQNDEALYRSAEGQVELGGLSDLFFSAPESDSQVKIYYTLTDRGPNGKEKEGRSHWRRPFLYPQYTPQILRLSENVTTSSVRVTKKIPLVRPDGRLASGLPNVDPRKISVHADELPVDEQGRVQGMDPWGLDPEGLVRDEKGNFWIAEEYGPSLLKVSPAGKILQRWLPQEADAAAREARGGLRALPAFLAERKLNRGFEALAWTEKGTLLAFLQSEVPFQKRRWSPILEFDPSTEKCVGLYYYPLDAAGGKIGAANLSPEGEILVLEQNGHAGPRAWQKVFRVSLDKGSNLIAEAMPASSRWMIPEKARAVGKKEVLDLTAAGLGSLEKLEGMSVDDQGDMALVNDNDFSVSGTGVPSYFILLKGKR